MANATSVILATFECTFCYEKKTFRPRRPFDVNGDRVCWQCAVDTIKPQFVDALKNENAFPVRWGATELYLEDFKGIFSATFQAEWKEKLKEYSTPANERVLCKHSVLKTEGESTQALEGSDLSARTPDELKDCGQFLGPKTAPNEQPVVCTSCGGKACRACGEANIKDAKHECEAVVEEEDPFNGMVRGQEYQICPKCPLPAMLADGCNAIWCHRDAIWFCFICGKQVQHNGGTHFMPGGCPKWNQPGAANAIYEQPGEAPMANDEEVAAWQEMLTELVVQYAEIQQQYEKLRQKALDSLHHDTTTIVVLTRQQEAAVYAAYIQEVQRFRNVIGNGDLPATMEHLTTVGRLAARMSKMASLVADLANNLEAKIMLAPGYAAVDPKRLVRFRFGHRMVVQDAQALHAFDAGIWADYPALWDIYQEYVVWAAGRLD
ncbi:hypothetical protein LTR56_003259 [Elasticomyces elasticus]|nr:hypothetical protein LTR22_017828 [Elasticomyces elasticus]KAK3656127.1 hypothetical protein LTR56_003259 [Elasticomyces elasticus]KAK4922318.1 hypothetical protein LTR49_010349 [Elasticomyces elasticus]KAK5763772.1 hypothetical protein LTS12_006106 [Elasticomyces elasticus]